MFDSWKRRRRARKFRKNHPFLSEFIETTKKVWNEQTDEQKDILISAAKDKGLEIFENLKSKFKK